MFSVCLESNHDKSECNCSTEKKKDVNARWICFIHPKTAVRFGTDPVSYGNVDSIVGLTE